MTITLDCKRGTYEIVPHKRTVSLTCDNCGSFWSSDYGGVLWHEHDRTYTTLTGSFNPIVVAFEQIKPVLARMKQLNREYDPADEIMMFLDDNSNEQEYNHLSNLLSAATTGKLSSLPSTGTLLIDDTTGRPICPDCYNSLLDILPF